ncbi:sensor histidine kinase [Leptospira sarikeiensis]|uniref:histidine kinase n=1 Tax=Leptospira sarikeiensis TaxID=2484943 RepID=A0A4V3JQX7_9LEPT|nr:sensor histidine kinase [Leptospira sarikeiensis]TGL57666.1 histidine kinase [Leptospira sarikeiensis]
MKIGKKYFVFFISCILILQCNSKLGPESPKVIRGSVDLREWSFQKDKTLALDGEWEFYWKEFLPIKQNPDPKTKISPRFAKVPAVWNSVLPAQEKGSLEYGYASYRAKIKLREEDRTLALYIPDLGTSYQLYANGELIAKAGMVGKSGSESNAEYIPQMVLLPKAKNLEIILYISNYQNRWGGFWNSIRLGYWEDISSAQRKKRDIEWALVLIAAIMAIYNVFFYFFRRNESAHLLFALHCFLIMIRSLTNSDSRLGYEFLQSLSWELPNRLEYMTLYASGPTFYAFLYRYCKTDFWRKYGHYFCIPYYIAVVLTIFFPNSIYTLTLLPISLYMPFVTMPIWGVLLVSGLRRRLEGVLVLFLGYAGISLCTVNDILFNYGVLNTFYMIQYGEVALILAYSILISKLFSAAFSRSDRLGNQMKSLVSSTREIMLSSSYSEAANSTLKILSEGKKENSVLFVYIEEPNSSVWKRYSIPSNGGLEIGEVHKYDIKDRMGLDPNTLSEPIVLNGRLIIPVKGEQPYLSVLDLPFSGYSDDSQIDWIQGIAHALSFSVRNIARQDREKLAIIGELSTEVVHDLGHSIAMIQQSLRNLENKKQVNRKNIISQAKKEVDALTNLTLDILDFSKNKIILDMKPVDIRSYFTEIYEDLILFSQSSDMKISVDLNAKGKIRLDPLRVRRLIFNLAKNASEAMSGSGIFSIRVEKESDVLYLIFEDNGKGFGPEILEYVYETGFNSKKPYGYGLGLSIIRKIVSAHGGEILLNSEEGKGSKFTILLPC